MAKALFISRDDLVSKTLLGGNVDSDKFLQFVEMAQDTHIQNYLGTDLYNKMSSDITGSGLSGDYLALNTNYVKPMLIHFAMSEYLSYGSFTVANGGVFKHTSENSQLATSSDLAYLINKSEQNAKHYADRFIKYMTYNAPTKFPEYYTNSNGDINPVKNINPSSWVL